MGTRTHKRKKVSRMHGRKMGTHGSGARKNKKGKGHHGGKGMSGTGKRADQKKTLMLKLYGHDYFGKAGITSRRTQRDKSDRINLKDIYSNIDSLVKRGVAKVQKYGGYEINLESYVILGDGNVEDLKKLGKLTIKAKKSSNSAMDKIKKAGGEIIVSSKEDSKSK
ncbi:hypothetical protein COU57_04310 [Candidatus Pacearchaeota archaeon CG10_big_fil_rev_8_21_14_0_10_32_14]|nr:MAG: hypothetical protein COU57_04310 [Candidatus Pacearchaeota archaeon CG10_big_fil_rev_8_21_14_0_10_32_14]